MIAEKKDFDRESDTLLLRKFLFSNVHTHVTTRYANAQIHEDCFFILTSIDRLYPLS